MIVFDHNWSVLALVVVIWFSVAEVGLGGRLVGVGLYSFFLSILLGFQFHPTFSRYSLSLFPQIRIDSFLSISLFHRNQNRFLPHSAHIALALPSKSESINLDWSTGRRNQLTFHRDYTGNFWILEFDFKSISNQLRNQSIALVDFKFNFWFVSLISWLLSLISNSILDFWV